MATDIGPKIGLQGKSQFKKDLADVNSQIRTLGSEMKVVQARFEGQEDSEEALAAKTKILTEQITKQREKIELLGKALADSAEKYGDNDSRTQKWKQQLNKATAELYSMENQLNGTTKELKDEGNQAEKAGDKTEESGDQAKKASSNWDALGSTVKIAGAAMAAAAAEAAAAIAAAAIALTNCTVEAAAFADEMLTMSSVTGMSTEKLQELSYAAELVDVSVDTVTGSMRKNLQSMTKAQQGTEDVAAVYERLGVAVTDADGNLRDSETVYWELLDALGQVEDETERDSLAMQVLGRSAQDLNPLIEAGSEKMAALAEDAHEAGYVMSEEALQAFGDFDDQLQRLDVGATAAKNALGTILLPVLTDLAGEGVDLLGEFTNGILDANGDIGAMGDVVGEILPEILDKVLQFVPEIITLAGTLITSLAEALMAEDNLAQILESARVVFESLVSGILALMPDLLSLALETITTLASDLLDPENITTMINTGISLLVTLIEGLTEALPELIPAAVDAILALVDALTDPDNLGLLIDASIALIFALADGLISSLPSLIEKAPEIIENLITAISENAPKMVEASLQLIIKLVEGIGSFLFKVGEAGRDIFDEIKQTIKDKVEQAKDWGKDLIDNFISGITEKWENLKQSVAGIAQTVADFLGFSEPEKGPLSKFHTFAPDMIDLFIQGLKQGEGRLASAMTSALTPAVADVRMNGAEGGASTVALDASSLSALSAGRSGETVVNVNFTGSLAQLGRLLQPEIQTAQVLAGASLIN